ncbi:MAG: cytochrome b/b6 domain-containing protein [Pseudanabaenaceae cyanobacterium]|jgi:thiosulfate reductase cytochrome b subunit
MSNPAPESATNSFPNSPNSTKQPKGFRQTLPSKIFHWVNLVSLFCMITSGLQIYNANPVFGGRSGFHFPLFVGLGGWLAGGRHWHFAMMWLFALNLLWYGVYALIWQRRRYVSGKDFKALAKSSNSKRRNYAWHRLMYTLILPVLALALFTGIGMYKPAQFYWIVDSFGGWTPLRVVHFMSIPLVLCFVVLHIGLARRSGGMKLLDSMFWE